MLGLLILPTSLVTGSVECTLAAGQEEADHEILFVGFVVITMMMTVIISMMTLNNLHDIIIIVLHNFIQSFLYIFTLFIIVVFYNSSFRFPAALYFPISRKFCTVNGSQPWVVTYLPHLLLAGAFSLVLVEKSFLAIFSANQKVEALHRLLVDHGILGSNPSRSPNPTSAGEVCEAFLLSPSSYRTSYLLRTCSELVCAGLMFFFLLLQGLPATLLSPSSLPCEVASSLYMCSGAPIGFYLPIIVLALLLLLLHLAANIYNLHWLLLNPRFKMLSLLPSQDLPWLSSPDFSILLHLLSVASGPGVALRTLLLLHPEMKPLLTPHPISTSSTSTPISTTSSTSTCSSLCLPLVPQLTNLGLHLSCLQEGEDQRKLLPWLKKEIKIEEGMSRASLLVQGSTITTNTFDLTGATFVSSDNVIDSTTTYDLDQSFDAEAKKDK